MKEKLVAGSAAGAISQTIIYPLEITKTRLTVAKPGSPAICMFRPLTLLMQSTNLGEYRGIWHCITSIVKQDGVLALFRLVFPFICCSHGHVTLASLLL